MDNDTLIAGLKHILYADKTEEYSYGERRFGDGAIPEKGSRWLTPREKARKLLDAIREIS